MAPEEIVVTKSLHVTFPLQAKVKLRPVWIKNFWKKKTFLDVKDFLIFIKKQIFTTTINVIYFFLDL